MRRYSINSILLVITLSLWLVTTYPTYATGRSDWSSRSLSVRFNLQQTGDPAAQCAKGVQLYFNGKIAEAWPLLEFSFANRETATFANSEEEGLCAFFLGVLRNRIGNPSGALEPYDVALNISRTNSNRELEAMTLHGIGEAYKAQGRYAEALDSYEKALVIFREKGNSAWEGAAFNSIGAVYDSQGRYAEALNNYEQALAVTRKTSDQVLKYITLSNIGLVYVHQSRYTEALEYYQQALTISRETGNRTQEGAILNGIGAVYDSQGRYAKALDSYEQALVISREIGDRESEATSLNNIGVVYDAQGHYVEALDSFEQALAIVRDMGNREQEGTTLSNIGLVYANQGRYAEALDSYEQALTIAREIDDQTGKGATLNGIGAVYDSQGRYVEALDAFQQALTISREVGNQAGEGKTLNNIGLVYVHQSRYTEALEYYQQALTISREIGNRTGEGTTLNNIGGVYDAQGRYAEALGSYERALTIDREVGDRAGEGTTLNNIGGVYNAQGRYAEALNTFERALTIHRGVGNRLEEGTTLNNIGGVYDIQGRDAEALESYQQALAISREVGNRSMEGTILSNIGLVYHAQDRYTEALESYQQALTIHREVGNRSMEGTTLSNIGFVYRTQGRDAEALESYQQALTIHREVGNRAEEAKTLSNIGAVYQAQEHSTEALHHYLQAIEIFEAVRATAGSEQGRAAFIAQYIPLYDRTIDLLHEQNQDEDAFFTAEQGRARAFLDGLTTGQVQLSDNAAANLLAQEQEFYAQRQVIRDNLAKARAQNPPDPDQVTDLEKQLAQANIDYTAIQAQIEARSDQLIDLIPGRNQHVLTVAQVQALLDPQTMLLSYYLLDDKTLAFLLARDSFQVVELPLSREDLTKKVNAFRKFVDTQTPDLTRQHLQELYQALIAPVHEALTQGGEAANNSRLLIVPHGVLHYLPFSALLDPDTNEYLLQRYEIMMLPSASVLQFVTGDRGRETDETEQEGDPTSTPLIVGNPATGDFDATASLATERAGLAPLPFAEAEARAIAALYGVEPLLGQAATESAVRDKVGEASILHLAAHGFYNSAAPLSSLIALAPDPQPLSSDGWLTVGEVYGLNLQQTALVVLSACQTQLGELKTVEGKVQLDVTAGDDVVGLTRAFLFAGTPTVVATLWNVNDEATQHLMERFYRHLKEGRSKAEALRQAQVELMEYDNGRYADPYYWAAFVLSGDGGATSEPSALASTNAEADQGEAAVKPQMTALETGVGNMFITGGLLAGVVGIIMGAWVLWRRARRG